MNGCTLTSLHLCMYVYVIMYLLQRGKTVVSNAHLLTIVCKYIHKYRYTDISACRSGIAFAL